jgi:para-aminobenzoate synthetase/4-amino-4-deoxychorismate lyase
VEYGVGSGIVWDSEAESEYDECFAKASVVTARADTFDLFETILWEAEGGYFLLERHIARLRDSCRYFGWSFDEARVRRELDEASRTSEDADQAWRVRLHLDRRGGVRVEFSELHPLPAPYTVALARDPVDSESHSLFHKTTNRSPYDTAEPVVPGVHDVILWNEKGEVTESRIANIVLDLDGELVTPPVESGLLAGCYRAELLEAGEIQERRVLKEELRRARAIYLVNSLRKMWRVELAQS